MRKWKSFLAIAVVGGGLFGIESCCKEYCMRQFMRVQFIGFDSSEVDTFQLTIYEPNGQFNQKIDSTVTRTYYHNNSSMGFSYTEDEVDLSKDLKITIPGASREFRITDIDTRKIACNCGPGYTKEVNAYTINGVQKNGNVVELNK